MGAEVDQFWKTPRGKVVEEQAKDGKHGEALRQATFYETVKHAVADGIDSVVIALSQLMAYRVPGFDDPVELAEAIDRSGVLEEFAMLLPFASIGPMSERGLMFPGPILEADGPGRVRFTAQMHDLLEREHQPPDPDRVPFLSPREATAGLGCPLGFGSRERPSAIRKMTGSLLERCHQLGGHDAALAAGTGPVYELAAVLS